MESTDSKCPTFSSAEEDFLVSQYHVQQTTGTFGQVKKAYHSLTDNEVTVKILGTKEYPMLVENQVDIVKPLNYPHVIRMYQVIQGVEHVYLVMGMATKGNLQSWIKASCQVYEKEARKLMKQMGSEMQYFHWHGIAHMDLKPDNILLDETGNAKVNDFGLSLRIAPVQLITDLPGAYVVCTPKIYLKQAYDSFKVDVLSLGTIMLFMIMGQFPFQESTFNQLCRKFVEGRYDVPQHLIARGHHVFFQLLILNPQQRSDVQQVMAHTWFDGFDEGSLYPVEPLPKQLYPTVVSRMCSVGYS
ncbi:sperm motility kinase-like [Thomomys bottae]